MDVFANELSITDKTLDDRKNVVNLRDVYSGLRARGINTCRIASADYNTLIGCIKDDISKKNLLSFIYSFLRAPYEGSEEVVRSQDDYFEHDWKCRGRSCFGLAMSHITDSIAVSFDDEWDAIVTIEKDHTEIDVRNAANAAHIEYHQAWFESIQKVELLETTVAVSDKCIALRDDHGKDVLLEFAKKVCRSPYVEGVVNSLPFNPKERKFIRRVKEQGLIECVLNWTDEGYGMVIKTTGRNIRETKKIAELLEGEFA